MTINSIIIKNKKVLDILRETQIRDFDVHCRPKGFYEKDYTAVSKFAVSDSYLQKRLNSDNINIEFAYNNIIGDTVAGKYLLENLKPLLNFGRYYTSGYDPIGFVGWHDDKDIFGYYVMLTYAKDTKGFFRYRDTETKEIITLADTNDWQVRIVKIGNQIEDIFWHCAYTESPRYTFLLHYDDQTKFNNAIKLLENE